MKYNKVFVFDLELTCWEKPNLDGTVDKTPPPGMVNEIIEIGYVLVDMKNRTISEPSSMLIKPRLSTLSDFCIQLTKITPEMIASEGMEFDKAVSLLKDLGVKKYPIAGYGQGDMPCLIDECNRKNVPYPLSTRYIDVKDLYAIKNGLKRGIGLKKAIQFSNITFKGTQHRAGTDAFATAELLLTLI